MTGFGKEAGPTASSSSQPRFGPPPQPAVFPHLAPRGPEAVQRPRSPPVAYQSSGFAASQYQSTGFPRRPEVLQGMRSSTLAFESLASPPYPSVAPKRPHASSLRWVNEHKPFIKDDAQTNAKPSVVTSFVASRNSSTSMTAMVARSQDQERARMPPSLSAYEDRSRNYSQTFPRMPAQTSSKRDNLPRSPINYSDLLTQEDNSSVLPHVGYHEIERNLSGDVADVHTQMLSQSLPVKEVDHEDSSFVHKEHKRPSISPPRLGVRSNASLIASDSQIPPKHLQSATHSAEAFPTRSVSLLVTKRARSPPLPSVDRVSEGNSDSNQDGADREIQAKAKRLARFRVELEDSQNNSDITEQKPARHDQSIVERKIFSSGYSTESAGDFADGNASFDSEGLETPSIIIGSCPDMCPESERGERERKGDLDQYERLDGDRNQTNKSLAVKKYSRTAEREATLIRPMPILQKTIDYLLGLLDQPYDDRFLGIYNFLWDRMRAIRLDLRMQHMFNLDAISMLEQMIRLHVIAMHELCEYNRGEGFSEGFDAHLNIEQMNKTSVELFQMYNDHRKKGLYVPTEKEFRGYYALLKLDKHPGYKVEPSELSLDLAKMTPEIRQTSEVLFARDVARACRTGNFIAFFRLARKASYLQACLMHAHFAKLRTQALASLHFGLQNNQGLPVACVAEWLGMEEEDIYSLLEYHGFLIKEFEEPYMVKEGLFLNGDKDYRTKCSKLVHLKKSRRIVEDVSPPQHQVSLPVRTTKDVRLPKIHKQATKTGPSALVEDKSSKHSSNQESSPNFFWAQPPREQSVVNQHKDHHLKSLYTTPWSFSSPHISSASHPTKLDSVEKISPWGSSSSHSPSATQPTKHGDVEKISPRGFSAPHSSSASHSTKLGDVEKISSWGFSSPHSSPASQPANLGAVEKISPWGYSSAHGSLVPPPVKFGSVEKVDRSSLPESYPERRILSGMQTEPSQIVSRAGFPEKGSSDKDGHVVNDSVHQIEAFHQSKDEELPDINQANENNEVIENYKDEVAEAKLKLIIRLWKRRASKLKYLSKQRQIAADAALSSMLLGPPIRRAENQSSAAAGFDIDHVVRERFEKHDQSWSKLNVSDVVMDVLRGRNPDAKCLCWKIILCSQINTQERDKLSHRNRIMPVSAGPWLISKLMPSGKDNDTEDEDMLISSPGLAIWRKWISSEPGSNLTCCLSVVKDVDFNHLDEAVAGASAVVFLVSESIPWSLQKIQLHNLMTSIPSGSSLPLLILSGSYNRELSDASSVIISELGVHELDKLKISSFSVLFLVGEKRTPDFDGFFSDLKLREGLRWLADESPLQPDLHCTKMRDLVLTCLNPSLDVLENMNDYEVGPDDCISAFNEALDWSVGEIEAAALANPTSWPCPEIALLENSCHEHTVAQLYLPGTGWSSARRIAPLLSAVRDCKLPSFPVTESWLAKGASMGKGIEKLILELETSLIRYLTESSKMMGFPIAAKEANLMLQRSSRLELCDSSYRVVPNWVMLFRRVFNWRLTRLSGGHFSSIYILKSHHVKLPPPVRDDLGIEASASSPYLSKPTLDEVIDAGCWTLQAERDRSPPEAFQPSDRTRSGSEGEVVVVSNTNDFTVNGRNLGNSDNLSDKKNTDHVTNGSNTSNTEIMVSGKATDGAEKLSNGTETMVSGKATDGTEKLSKLLEQCNIVQNSIDAKLSIYF